jgi:phosphoadenosine phosphosulfate reductase
MKGVDKTYVHPILDWTDDEVWEYLRGNGLPYNPLYDDGWKRIGCVLCPKGREVDRFREKMPKMYEAWRRAVMRTWERRKKRGMKLYQDSGEAMWEWWIDRDASPTGKEPT